jgi:hypothetical protein
LVVAAKGGQAAHVVDMFVRDKSGADTLTGLTQTLVNFACRNTCIYQQADVVCRYDSCIAATAAGKVDNVGHNRS